MKAIGFDLGDTLVFYGGTPLNWKSLYPQALRFMAASLDIDPSADQIAAAETILERYNTRINPRSLEVSSDEIIGAVLKAWSLQGAIVLDTATANFFRFFQRELCVYDDTAAVLRKLKLANVSIGILTDVPYGMMTKYVMQDLTSAGNLDALIDILITSVDVGYRKPESVGYLKLAASLGVAPEDMVYVGNEEKDIEGAVGAGMPAVLISRDGSINNWGQMATISQLTEIFDVLF